MANKKQHVVLLGNGWAVKGEGNDRFSIITETKKEAIEFAREVAKNNGSELVIHGKDGKILEKDNYEKIKIALREKSTGRNWIPVIQNRTQIECGFFM